MIQAAPRFTKALGRLDQTPFEPLLESDIFNLIQKEVADGDSDLAVEERAELMAFRFIEGRKEKGESTAYFRPILVTTNEDGSLNEFPSVADITEQMIDYWRNRAETSQHPVLIARYAGLVYEFSFTRTGKNPHFTVAKRFIEALLDTIVSKLYKVPVYAIGKAKRALEVALLMNHAELIVRAKNSILWLEAEIAVDEKPGLWGFSFDFLINGRKKLVTLEEETQIIAALEKRLSNLQEMDAWASECAAKRLAQYYHTAGQTEQVKRILNSLKVSFEKVTMHDSSVQKAHHTEMLYRYYLQFGLREEADIELIRLREISKETDQELKSISAKIDVPKEKIDAYVDQLLKGEDDVLFARIIAAHTPRIAQSQQEIEQQFKEAPLQFILAKSLVDKKGRAVAHIGPLREDPDSHLILHLSNSIRIGTIFLHFTFEEGIKREVISVHEIMKFLRKSCLIEQDRFGMVEKGLEAYFSQDYLTCIHLLIPQFEEAIRNLVEINGGSVLVPKNDSFQLKTFDYLLSDPLVKEVFGEDASLYFKVLFTDKRGWNLRNDLAHGMLDSSHFNKQNSDRLLHAFLCLGMVRLMEK